MKKESLYSYMKIFYKDKLVFIKSGTFYNTYEIDSLIVSKIFDYKIVDNRCSFPISATERIVCNLNKLGINVVLVNDEKNIDEISVESNRYNEFFIEAKKSYEFNISIDRLKEMMENKLTNNPGNYEKLLSFINEL